ncbi:MAG TPA: hypothetical protein VND97_04005 [Beijerinckiaceae bacterium]|nr:hypothetical protein [Beijerinckiaceae bacterium]
MKILAACAGLALLAASTSLAIAQPAPENRPSTTMQKNGGPTDMNSSKRPMTGRSVAAPVVRHGNPKYIGGTSLTGESNKSSGQ